MANLNLTPTWDGGVYRIETSDPVIGGENGISNKGIKNLGNRTEWLKQKVDALSNAIGGYKHCVIQGLNSNADPIWLDNSVISLGNTSMTVSATVDNPLIASITCGYNSTGLVNKYVYLTESITASNDLFSPNGKLFLLFPDETVSVVNMVSYSVSYSAPLSPSDKALWYDLNRERMYIYSTSSSTWSPYDCLVLATITNDAVLGATYTYTPLIGRGVMDLYGINSVHVGIVSTYAGTSVSLPGYLLCDGSAVNRIQYRSLFQAIGTTYGPGDGSTTFELPDIDDTSEGLKHFIKAQ